MSNHYYEERLKICYFRLIVDEMIERNIITKDEHDSISRKIDKMENALVSENLDAGDSPQGDAN